VFEISRASRAHKWRHPEFRASREYSHAKPLVSELPDGFAAKPNRILPPAAAERDALRE
jgi:hypothetical protein